MKDYYKHPNTKISVAKGIYLKGASWIFTPPKGSKLKALYNLDPIALSEELGVDKSIISTIPDLPNISIGSFDVILSITLNTTFELSWRFEKDSISSFSLALNEAIKTKAFFDKAHSITKNNSFATPERTRVKPLPSNRVHYIYPNKQFVAPIGLSATSDNNWVYRNQLSSDNIEDLFAKAKTGQVRCERLSNLPSINVNYSCVTLKTVLHEHVNISWPFNKDMSSSFSAAIREVLKVKYHIDYLKASVGLDVFKAYREELKKAA